MLFIIENKPSKENIWIEQLNPNIDNDITIKEEPCCLTWKDIINSLNNLVSFNLVSGLERIMIIDFIEYVDNEETQMTTNKIMELSV